MDDSIDDKEVQEKWPVIKQKLLQEHPQLTEEELKCEIGKEGEHLRMLQKKLGKNWTEIRNLLSLMG